MPALELATFASAASKEVSAVVKLLRDLIRFDQLVAREVDKRQIRNLCRDLRVLYFEPGGTLGAIRRVLEDPPSTGPECLAALSAIRRAHSENKQSVVESIERVRQLKPPDNLEISLELYELVWRVGLVLEYAIEDLDQYGNQPEVVVSHLRAIAAAIEVLNTEIVELEAKLRQLN
jgi:hypothetical protein